MIPSKLSSLSDCPLTSGSVYYAGNILLAESRLSSISNHEATYELFAGGFAQAKMQVALRGKCIWIKDIRSVFYKTCRDEVSILIRQALEVAKFLSRNTARPLLGAMNLTQWNEYASKGELPESIHGVEICNKYGLEVIEITETLKRLNWSDPQLTTHPAFVRARKILAEEIRTPEETVTRELVYHNWYWSCLEDEKAQPQYVTFKLVDDDDPTYSSDEEDLQPSAKRRRC